MFMGRKDTSPGWDTKRPGSGFPPPSQSSAGRASAHQPGSAKKKSGAACNPVMWTSIMALPWVTFILCGIIIAATIAWQDYFLRAARRTGEVLTLVQSQHDSYPYRIWRPHRKLVIGTAISIEVITLFVVIAAVLRMMQSAVGAGRMRRGPPRNHTWSSIYLAVTGGAAVLMWFAIWWMVMLLGVSVAWQFGAVTTRNMARGALTQAQAYSKVNAINLAAPSAPQQILRKYNKDLRPSLDAATQKRVQTFLDQTVLVADKVKLTVCPSTCLDVYLLRGALGSAQCVCDAKKLRQISDLASSVSKIVISVIACIVCNAVAASLLVIDLVTRFIYARQEYEALGPRVRKPKASPKKLPAVGGGGGGIPASRGGDVEDDVDDTVYEEEEEEEAGFAKGAPPGEEKVMNWNVRPPSVASAQSSIPPGFQAPQARPPAASQQQAAQQQAAAQQRAQQQAAQQRVQQQAAQQRAQQQAAQQRAQQAAQQQAVQQAALQAAQQRQQMMMQLQQQQAQQSRKQQAQHYSYAQQIQQQRMMQQQGMGGDADSVMGSDQQSVASAWVMRR